MMHNDQVNIDTDIVANMIHEQFPQYCNLEIKKLDTQGTMNAIYRIGDKLAAKFPLRLIDNKLCNEQILAEASAMKEISQCTTVPCAQMIGIGQPSIDFPMHWIIQDWLEGDIATPIDFSSSTSLAQDISDLILNLRSAHTHQRRFDGKGRGGNLTDHDDWISTCLKKSKNLLDVDMLHAIWVRLRQLPHRQRDVMSHKDLIPANLLVQNQRLIGLLDCGSFGPADSALDLVAAWHLFDSPRRELIKENLQSDDIEWKRGAAWAFQQALGLVWYYEKSNPAMSALGRSTLIRIINDPDI
ncbi:MULTISPECIES: phosphotransferase [Acinetobacter]|uniref:phosphotransferase n=1 Tax=Acinetobacter TaxID=469 RepID=UPI0009D76356|nr:MULTISPECIES: phosphotransferase [Acinetobacter]